MHLPFSFLIRKKGPHHWLPGTGTWKQPCLPSWASWFWPMERHVLQENARVRTEVAGATSSGMPANCLGFNARLGRKAYSQTVPDAVWMPLCGDAPRGAPCWPVQGMCLCAAEDFVRADNQPFRETNSRQTTGSWLHPKFAYYLRFYFNLTNEKEMLKL